MNKYNLSTALLRQALDEHILWFKHYNHIKTKVQENARQDQ